MRKRGLVHKKSRIKSRSNPKSVVIYGAVTRIEATKTQPHRCDAACKRCGHRYYHDFRSKPMMVGLANGDILIRSRRH